MSIQSTKLMNLADGKVLYDDLRSRIESGVTEKSINQALPYIIFHDSAALPMEIETDFMFTQSGTGDPSIENVRTMFGRTQADIRIGENILDHSTSTLNQWIDYDGTIKSSGGACYSDLMYIQGDKIIIEYSTPETNNTVTYRIHGYTSTGEWIQQIATYDTFIPGNYRYEVDIPEGIEYIRLSYRMAAYNVQVISQSEYQSNVIQFPASSGTSYVGTLKVNADGSAQLIHTYIGFEYDGSEDEEWQVAGDGTYKMAVINVPVAASQTEYSYCNEFTYADIGTNVANTGYDFVFGRNRFRFRDQLYTSLTVDEIRAFLAAHPLQIVYKLETPIVYNFAPGKIFSAKGSNLVFADCGNIVGVKYIQDPSIITESIKGIIPVIDDAAGSGAMNKTWSANKLSSATAKEVLEYDDYTDFPLLGTAEIVYIDKTTNYMYRWNTNAYTLLGGSSPEAITNNQIDALFT